MADVQSVDKALQHAYEEDRVPVLFMKDSMIRKTETIKMPWNCSFYTFSLLQVICFSMIINLKESN